VGLLGEGKVLDNRLPASPRGNTLQEDWPTGAASNYTDEI